MSRQPHDSLAKQFLADLLEPLGSTTTRRDVIDEPRQIDVYFEPADPLPPVPPLLGLFGRIATATRAIEVFRNPPDSDDFEDSLNKLLTLRIEQRRRSDSAASAELWLLSPTLSPAFRRRYGATPRPDCPEGVYAAAEGFCTNMVAIHQLPVTPETLMLRVLGRGRTQQAAADAIADLPESPPVERILALLANWRRTIEIGQSRDRDDEEVLVNLSPAFIRFRDETREEGRQEGLQAGRQEGLQEGRREERRDAIATALRVRFGDLDPELTAILPTLVEMPLEEALQLVLTSSCEQLLAR